MMDLEKLMRSNIKSLKPYSSARDEFSGTEGVFLDANENPYGDLNRYPDPYQKNLKAKLSKLKKVAVEHIFVGNGSDEIIDLAFRIFCDPGMGKALTFSPTYGMYDVSAAINDVQLIKVPLLDNFQIDSDELTPYLQDDQLKLIFICSPNNPTGNSFNKSDIIDILNKFKGLVIIDEAYIDFSQEASWVELFDHYPNLLVSQTFSKAWGLAAARVGVAYAQKDIIDIFNKVKPPYNVSGPNQNAAIKALSDTANFEQNVQLILDEKTKMVEALEQISLVKKVYPSDANFLLIEVVGADQLYQELVDKKVIVRNRNSLVNNCIRVSIGNQEENEKLIVALKSLTR
jgi:histidinol-phosphate aminotransferase